MPETKATRPAPQGQGKTSAVILHDYVEQTDGGSRLCLVLGRALGADFCCGFARPGHPFLAAPYPGQVRTLMPALAVPLARQLALALAFEHRTHFVKNYGTAVFSGAYAPLAAKNRSGPGNVYYCHTPPRFLYDQHDFFLNLAPQPLRPLFSAFCQWLRPRYEASLAHMGVVVANSHAVQQRVRRYLGLDSVVVFPPCNMERYRCGPDQGYYLSMARLDPLKRVDVAVKAFLRLPQHRLVITSDGPEAARLRRLAHGAANISFTGAVSEERLLGLLANCRATICVSKDEDFGMAAVESLAAGKPVLAAAAGGFRETVLDGRTGEWLPPDVTPEELAQAVTSMNAQAASRMAGVCREQAEKFSTPVFLAGMAKAMRQAA